MTPDADPSSNDALPPRLLADLHGLQRTPAVPPAMDAGIRTGARAYFARQRRVRLWARVGGALAAAVVLTAGLRLALPPGGGLTGVSRQQQQQQQPLSPSPSATRLAAATAEDVDANGVVDVLDALAVARRIKAGRPDGRHDVNRDGAVDQADVDAVAAAAVRVKGRVR